MIILSLVTIFLLSRTYARRQRGPGSARSAAWVALEALGWVLFVIWRTGSESLRSFSRF